MKESLFSILGAAVDDAVVLDLFAGTGALGLEALSRGAKQLVLVEHDRQALVALKKNVTTVGGSTIEILPMSAERALKTLSQRGLRFDLVFIDPPYEAQLWETSLAALAAMQLVRDAGIVVCEHPGRDTPPAPPDPWQIMTTRRYGDVALTLYAVAKGVTP